MAKSRGTYTVGSQALSADALRAAANPGGFVPGDAPDIAPRSATSPPPLSTTKEPPHVVKPSAAVNVHVEVNSGIAFSFVCRAHSYSPQSRWLVLTFDTEPPVRFGPSRLSAEASVLLRIQDTVYVLDSEDIPNSIQHDGCWLLLLSISDSFPHTETDESLDVNRVTRDTDEDSASQPAHGGDPGPLARLLS
jgi:hypothetical protein